MSVSGHGSRQCDLISGSIKGDSGDCVRPNPIDILTQLIWVIFYEEEGLCIIK